MCCWTVPYLGLMSSLWLLISIWVLGWVVGFSFQQANDFTKTSGSAVFWAWFSRCFLCVFSKCFFLLHDALPKKVCVQLLPREHLKHTAYNYVHIYIWCIYSTNMYIRWMAAPIDPTNESATYKMVVFVWVAYHNYIYIHTGTQWYMMVEDRHVITSLFIYPIICLVTLYLFPYVT
jgi:hypothetical protein